MNKKLEAKPSYDHASLLDDPDLGGVKMANDSIDQGNIRKRQMLDKARVLFRKKGYAGASMKDLAKAFGCKPANIYNYFESKEDLLFEVLHEEMEQIIIPVAHLEFQETLDVLPDLLFFIKNHTCLTLSHRRSASMLFDTELGHLSTPKRSVIVDMRRQYDRILCRLLETGVSQGIFRPTNVKLVAYSIASMIARSRVWYSPEGSMTPDEIGAFIYNFAVEGLRVWPASDLSGVKAPQKNIKPEAQVRGNTR